MARIKRSLRGNTRKGHRRRKTGQLSQKKVKIVVVVIIEKEDRSIPFGKLDFLIELFPLVFYILLSSV
jgi:hypothetical protein